MSANHETDSEIENIKTWQVEWSSSVEEFDNYSQALDLFNLKSNQGEDTILYEIQKSKRDGSLVKKIPILNTKQSKKRKEELEKINKKKIHQQQKKQQQQKIPTQNKNKLGDIKYRIIILVIIVVAFLILLYVLSQLVTTSSKLNTHLIFSLIFDNLFDIDLISYTSIVFNNS